MAAECYEKPGLPDANLWAFLSKMVLINKLQPLYCIYSTVGFKLLNLVLIPPKVESLDV
jgi:hypothetical protein